MSKRHSGFLTAIQSDHFKWAFNVAHGHLVPEGWTGFLDAFGVDNIGQVRLNDNNGDYEIHLVPGEGTIDFDALFKRLNAMGYEGWFSLGFGNAADKIRIKNEFEENYKEEKHCRYHSYRTWTFGHAPDLPHALCQRYVHGTLDQCIRR